MPVVTTYMDDLLERLESSDSPEVRLLAANWRQYGPRVIRRMRDYDSILEMADSEAAPFDTGGTVPKVNFDPRDPQPAIVADSLYQRARFTAETELGRRQGKHQHVSLAARTGCPLDANRVPW